MTHPIHDTPAQCRRSSIQPIALLLLLMAAFGFVLNPLRAATTGDPSVPTRLISDITYAYSTGVNPIVITPGTYQLPAGSAPYSLSGLFNVTIDGKNQVSFEPADANDGSYAFQVANCTNVTFQNFALHNPQPRTIQGTITSISGKDVYVTLHAGYTTDYTRYENLAYVFDQTTGYWKVGCGDSHNNIATSDPNYPNDPTKCKVTLTKTFSTMAVGDYLVGRGGGWHIFNDLQCTNCTFNKLKVYYGGLFQFLENGGSGNHFLNCSIGYGATPPGATIAPLVSSSADGLHSYGARVGPDVENCDFEGMCDDAINVVGSYATLYSGAGTIDWTVESSSNASVAQAGDTVYAVQLSTGYYVKATLHSVTPIPPPQGAPKGDQYDIWELTAAINPALPSGAIQVYDFNQIGSNFIVKNNTVKHNRARAVRVLGSYGTITGNTIIGSTGEAVRSSDTDDTVEAGISNNLTVTNNAISGVNQMSLVDANEATEDPSAIYIDPPIPTTGTLIDSNTLTDVFPGNIHVANTNATITNNVITLDPNPGPLDPALVPVDFTSTGNIIRVDSTATVSESHNAVDFEAEDMTLVNSSGQTYGTANDGNDSGGKNVRYSSTAVGQYFAVLAPGVQAGTYTVQLGAKTNTYCGILQSYLGTAGQTLSPLGSTIDEYGATMTYPLVTLSSSWSSGSSLSDKWLQLKVTGKNASSTNYNMLLDYVRFQQPQ